MVEEVPPTAGEIALDELAAEEKVALADVAAQETAALAEIAQKRAAIVAAFAERREAARELAEAAAAAAEPEVVSWYDSGVRLQDSE